MTTKRVTVCEAPYSPLSYAPKSAQAFLKVSFTKIDAQGTLDLVASTHGRNFVVKCGGAAWCKTNIVIGSMQKLRFIYTVSQP